jgi:hypothetical protein
MTWSSPATPISGTVITVAFWNTNARDNLNHIRTIVPDPGSSGLPLVSTGPTSAAFGQVSTSGLVDKIITNAKIDDTAVDTLQLKNDAVTNAKIAETLSIQDRS